MAKIVTEIPIIISDSTNIPEIPGSLGQAAFAVEAKIDQNLVGFRIPVRETRFVIHTPFKCSNIWCNIFYHINHSEYQLI